MNQLFPLHVLLALPAFALEPTQLPGWPVHAKFKFGSRIYEPIFDRAPVVADIGDYSVVVALGSMSCIPGGFIGVYRPDGSPQPGWPKNTLGALINRNRIAVGTLGSIPAIVASTDAIVGLGCGGPNVGKVFAWTVNGDLLPGWPRPHGGAYLVGLELVDLDGDGELDVVATTQGYSGTVIINAWDAAGTFLPGWPIVLSLPGGAGAPEAVVGDVLGDGSNQVVVPLYSGSYGVDSRIVVLSHTGETLSEWSVPNAHAIGSVVLVDLDADGILDILASVTLPPIVTNGKIFAFDGRGNVLSGWPVDTGGYPYILALANLDDNACPTIFMGTSNGLYGGENAIYSFDCRGHTRPGWPIMFDSSSLSVAQGPVIGDIDGDGVPEILATVLYYRGVGQEWSQLYAWRTDGTPIPQYTFRLSSANAGGSPSLVDLNRDGQLEIVTTRGWTSYLNAFALPATYDPQHFPWPMYRRNPQRTAVYR